MLRENGTTRLNVAPSRSSAQDDPFLTAVKEAAAADFTVLGEIGRGEGGVIMYLARDMESRRLVALRLQREGQLADEFSLEVVRHLDNSMPAPDSHCVKCGKAVKGWARFCSYCGADLTGAAPKEGDAVERALMLEAVKDAVSADYEVLGEMSRTEGGGAVYFALERSTGRIVALRLQREAGDEFSVGLTTALKPIARSLGVKAPPTQALSALSRPESPPPPPTVPDIRPAPPPPPAPSGPAAPPPLPPAAAGLSARTKVMIAALAAVILATALIVLALPRSAPAPAAPLPPDTARAVVPAPPADTARRDTAAGPAVAARDTARPAPAKPAAAPALTPARPRDATVRVTGIPAAAEIRVDDRIRVGRSLTLAPGRHVLGVSVAGYLPRADTMVLRSGETINWSPALTPEPPKPQPVAAAPKPATPAGPTCAASVQAEKWAAAFESCMRESLAGNAAARRNLAMLYERGRGVEHSEENATRWYESAATGGDRDAMYQLAQRYERGRGVKKDQAKALEWYTKAGDAGLASAQYTLGETYEKGRLGVAKDKAKALEWYRKAAAQGNKDAADKVKDLAK